MNNLRLPDGAHTTDVTIFLEAWGLVTEPFENLGFRVARYDPGVMFYDSETGQGTFTLPSYAAVRISKRLRDGHR